MKRLLTIIFAGAVLLAHGAPAGAQTGGFKVVVNQANPARGLARNKIAMMFMKATAKWESGTPVEPVDQKAASAARAAFTREIHNRDVDGIMAAWQRAVFAGRGEPPPQLAGDEEVIAFVASRPGAIGYVSADAATDKVKVLDVLK